MTEAEIIRDSSGDSNNASLDITDDEEEQDTRDSTDNENSRMNDLVEIKFERQRFCSNVKSNFLALKNKMISWLTLKTKIKYHNKLSKPLSEKNISRIIVGLLGVVIILIPMVIARLLISWRGNENAYIFYRNLNQTKIIRVRIYS